MATVNMGQVLDYNNVNLNMKVNRYKLLPERED